jgi:anti-sigma factor RsiW
MASGTTRHNGTLIVIDDPSVSAPALTDTGLKVIWGPLSAVNSQAWDDLAIPDHVVTKKEKESG